jgi:uncharacterized protein (TIGR03437 family)
MKTKLPVILGSLSLLTSIAASAQIGQPTIDILYPLFGNRTEICPGEMVGASGKSLIGAGGPGAVGVTVNGGSVPVWSTNQGNGCSESCVFFQIPPQASPGAASITISNGSAATAPFLVQLIASAPDLGSVPFPGAAAPGDKVVFNLTGLGSIDPAQPVIVTLGGLPAATSKLFQGMGSPLAGPGIYSFTCTVPAGLTPGRQPVTFSIAGVSSNATSFLVLGPPTITTGGIVPEFSNVSTIQTGEWVSIYGASLASSTSSWTGAFTTALAGTSVTINGKAAYLSYVSPTQLNLQAPDDTTIGSVSVVVTTALGTAASTVTLAKVAPSFLLLDGKHVAGLILRSNGSGAYGGGTYDILGPAGNSLGYATVAAKAGDMIELFAVGLGPTTPTVPAGQAFSGAAPTNDAVALLINNMGVTPAFVGLSSAGLYQINLTVPAGLGRGDVSLKAIAGGVQTPLSVLISLQ